MWEANMSASKVKRSWSRLSRPAFSPAPKSPTWGGDSAATPPKKPPAPKSADDETSSQDQSLLQNLKKLLSDFDQLHVIDGAPLTDQRVVTMRQWVEKGIPRLYWLADENAPLSSHAQLVKRFAEDFLRKFPDVNIGELRAKHSADSASHPSSKSNDERTAHATDSTPAAEEHGSNDKTRKSSRPAQGQNQAEGIHNEITSLDARRALAQVTPEQEVMLAAVHEMLGSNADSVFEPPAALSPDEVQMRLSSTADAQSFPSRSQEMLMVPPSVPPHLVSGQNVR